MKRVNNLYDDICNLDNIIKMADKVCSRVKNKEKVARFDRAHTKYKKKIRK